MDGVIGIVIGADGSIRDVGILSPTPEGRRSAQELLFLLGDAIDTFEATARQRISLTSTEVRATRSPKPSN